MAVYPDRIVLKNSTDSLESIATNIGAGGSDEILSGEVVLGLGTGTARLFTRDANGTVVQFGGSDATLLGGLNDVDLGGLADDQFIQYDEDTGLWKPVSLTFGAVDGVVFDNAVTILATYPYFSVEDRALLSNNALVGGTGVNADFLNVATSEYLRFGSSNTRLRVTDYLEFWSEINEAEFRFFDNNNSNYIGLKAPQEVAADVSFVLPGEDGPTGYVLTTDGAGQMSWSSGPAPDLGSANLGQLGDVDLTDLANGNMITYDEDSDTWTPEAPVRFFDDLQNVSNSRNTPVLDVSTFSVRDNQGERVTISSYGSSSSIYFGGDIELGTNIYGRGIAADGPINIASYANASVPGTIRLGRMDTSNYSSTAEIESYVGIQAPDTATDHTMILPPDAGQPGQVLGTDALGQLGWYDTYPPVGNGLIEITITDNNGILELSGDGFDGGYYSRISVHTGLAYRFDNQTGRELSIKYNNNDLVPNVTNNGSTGLVIGWTVDNNLPSTARLEFLGGETIEVMIYGADKVPLQHNSINDLDDVDTETITPSKNQALVWNGSEWEPSPVFSELGVTYLQGQTWNQFTDTIADIDLPGTFFLEENGGFYSLYIDSNPALPLATTSFETLFNTLIADGTALWANLVFTDTFDFTYKVSLAPIESFTNVGNAYLLTWLESFAYVPTLSRIQSVTIELIERKLIEIPVLSVNGEIGDVSLGITDMDDFYSDLSTDLENGHPWLKGNANNNRQCDANNKPDSGGIFQPSITLANLDSLNINRRPQMTADAVLYVRSAANNNWVFAGGTPDIDAASNSVAFVGVTEAAQDLITLASFGELFYFKFALDPVKGYNLEDKALIQYDVLDQKWKPVTEAADTELNVGLNDLIDVEVENPYPQQGQALVWDLTRNLWVPGTATGGEASPAIVWTISAPTSSAYVFEGNGFDGPTSNPILYVMRGQSYTFDKTTAAHPFQLQTSPGLGQPAYTDGVTGSPPLGQEEMTWVVPMDAPDELYYQCTAHLIMSNQIRVVGAGNVSSLNDLDDVDTATNSPNVDQVLVWDGTRWVPGDQSTGPQITSIDDLEDVDTSTTAPLNGQALVWNASKLDWVPGDVASVGGVSKIIAGTNIEISPSSGEGEVTINALGGGGGAGNGSGAGIHLEETQTSVSGLATFSALGMSGILQNVSSVDSAWIVLYSSDAQRSADSSRAFDEDPLPGSGVLFEAYVGAGGIVTATPGTTYLNSEEPTVEAIYARVRDQDGNSVNTAVTVKAFGLAAITAINGGTFGSGL